LPAVFHPYKTEAAGKMPALPEWVGSTTYGVNGMTAGEQSKTIKTSAEQGELC
jgi:hypothetical protein